MALELTRNYQLRTNDFDCYARLHPAAGLDVFQDVAAVQADAMGIGFDDMFAQGVFWAVVRIKYEVLKQPAMHEDVAVRTWPHSPSRFSFKRDYSMKNMKGELCVKATSEWVLMDFAERKLAMVADHYAGPNDFSDDRCFTERVRKVADVELEGVEPYEVVPRLSDVDVNGHVNNARYAAYVFDALDLPQDKAIRSFQIDFRHEVIAGEPLLLYCVGAEDGSTTVLGKNEAGETSFACIITYFGE